MWGFIHSPFLSLFRVHWRELMSPTPGPRWLICTKRSNRIASPPFNFLFETLPVLGPMSQSPPFESSHSAPCWRLRSQWASPSMKPFPDTLAPRACLANSPALCHAFWVHYVRLRVFILTDTVCLSHPHSWVCISGCSKHSLFCAVILAALNRLWPRNSWKSSLPPLSSRSTSLVPLLWP